jgi:probable F420-dependent oxidoreductase
MSTWSDTLGTVGVWRGFTQVDAAFASEIESLGYGALWLGYSPEADLQTAEQMLDATERLHLATGVVNIWKADAAEVAASFHRIEAKHPGRFLLGIGSGHREATPERARPLEAMKRYLDVLDEHEVPAQRRVISALGPRMLELAAERSAGTHPYLTIPAQSAEEREALGDGVLVAPEQTVVLDTDRDRARESARTFLTRYLGMSNYTNTMRRGGFSEQDVEPPGSDRLVDDIVAQGDAAALAVRIRQHLDAGADHVSVQVVPARDDALPALRAIAAELRLA